jgi:hypothetical protein
MASWATPSCVAPCESGKCSTRTRLDEAGGPGVRDVIMCLVEDAGMPLRYASDLVHDVVSGRAVEVERAPGPREDGGLARPREADRVAARELQETPFFCICLVEDAARGCR